MPLHEHVNASKSASGPLHDPAPAGLLWRLSPECLSGLCESWKHQQTQKEQPMCYLETKRTEMLFTHSVEFAIIT